MPGAADMTMRGKDEHLKRLRRLSGPEVIRAAEAVLRVGGEMIQAEAQVSINRAKHGKLVKGQKRKEYTASAPGEAPAYDTEDLRNGIGTYKTGTLVVEVQSRDRKSEWLEFGTSKMAARPFMRPARDKSEPKIQRLFAKEITKLVERSG